MGVLSDTPGNCTDDGCCLDCGLTKDEAIQLLKRLDWPNDPQPSLVSGRDKLLIAADPECQYEGKYGVGSNPQAAS